MADSNDTGPPSATFARRRCGWGFAVVICAVWVVAAAHPARAGINVWTSHEPPGGDARALAVYPIMPISPNMLCAGTFVVVSGARVPAREGGSHDTFE